MERLFETHLPSHEGFFNSFHEAELSKSCEHARNVWMATGCRSQKNYLLFYVKADVGLCDVHQEWRGPVKFDYCKKNDSVPIFANDSSKTQQKLRDA